MRVVTTKQTVSFVAGIAVLWFAADWPMHDIAENYLYSAHMIQHMLMAFVAAPLFLLATPVWLAEIFLSTRGPVARAVLWITRPVPAGVIFNSVTILLHWPAVVRLSVQSGPLHFAMHLLMFSAALLMWTPICGPIAERRLVAPAKMIYLFLQSVVPTIPAGWLTFAENPVYKVYAHEPRLWGISVISDQQAAGAIMKIIGGFYLWVIIAVVFFRWAASEERRGSERPIVVVGSSGELTFEEVADTFERLGPPPVERVPPAPRDIGDPGLN
jgi:putative membrane protein